MTSDRLFDDTPTYGDAAFPPPRPFQAAAHEALREGRRDGHRCQLLMAPTGGGKTYLGLQVCYQALRKGKRSVFVCDRTALIDQTSAAADQYGLGQHGVIQAQHWRFDPSMPFQIASVGTLARRSWPDADVIVVDEAHTQYKMWTDHIRSCRASVIGLSATPFSAGLGKLFTRLINATTMHELTQSGVLVPLRVYSCTRADMRGAETAGGEWTDRAAAERGMAIVGDVVAEWIKYAEGRKTIVFGAKIDHCEELCRQFNASGIMAAAFTSDTKPDEREALLKEYRKPDSSLRVLISVEALAKGFDVPDVGCVVDCRPLRKSLSTAIQMWGRGLRSSPETGKQDCILLDHSGNILRFQDDFERIYFHGLDALDTGEKLDKTIRRDDDKPEPKGCPACGYKPFAKHCMSCGHTVQARSDVEHLPGEMQPVMIGKKKIADDQRSLWEQVCAYTRMSKTSREKWQARASCIYKDISGGWPPRSWHIDRTPDALVTKTVEGQIVHRNIAYAKSREKAAA